MNVSKVPIADDKIHPKLNEYITDEKEYKRLLYIYNKKMYKWKREKTIWTQPIAALGNNRNTRLLIYNYIKNNSNNKKILKIFSSNILFEDKLYSELMIVKGKQNNPYHWIMECKDYYCLQIDNRKPIKPYELVKSPFIKSCANPRHLINNLELIPYWKKYYDINLVVIKISIKENYNNAKYLYKKIYHERCINEYNEPYIKNTKIKI